MEGMGRMEPERRFAGGRRRRKLGELVAERIVAEIIHRGWTEGEVLGTEADIMDHFRVSRATFREAIRQLEWSGIVTMRRGAHGGLVVNAVPRHAIIQALKSWFELSKAGRPMLDEAAAILDSAPRMMSPGPPNAAIALFLEALDERSPAAMVGDKPGSGSSPKLSEQVALRLVQDIEASGAGTGASLGSQEDLQRRYNVSRAVLREALRPLELHDIVRVKTGAHGGVILRQCDPEYTIDLTATYLAYSRISLTHLWEAQSVLEIAAVAGFTARADAATLVALDGALVRLEQASADHYLASACEFHRLIAEHSGNAALALFVNVLLRYGLTVMPKPDAQFLPELKRRHRQLLDAVRHSEGAEARAQMEAMFEHSHRWIARLERDRQQAH